MSNNIVIYKKRYSSYSSIILFYDDNRFIINNIEDYYKYKDFVEFLPGIYIKVEAKLKELANHIDIENLNFLKFTKSIFIGIWNRIFFDNQYIKIIFKIENKRDFIKLFINDEIKYISNTPSIDELHSKYIQNKNNLLNSEDLIDYEVKFESVDTDNILYPFQSGGGGERCDIKNIFFGLNILNEYLPSTYTFFTEHEMFLSSSYNKSLMNVCENFPSCKNLYNKFVNGDYVSGIPDKWYDDIELKEANGIYEITNANHRVCIAKRFKIPNVYAKIETTGNKSYKESINRHNPFDYIDHYDRVNNIDILNHFYNTLDNLQLNKDNGRYILKHGLRGKELLGYIEHITGKTIYQLYMELDKAY